jgi:acyl carrier protein
LEAASTFKQRRSLLIAHVRAQVARVLGLPESALKNLQQGFQDLGLDSLMSMELRNSLQTSLQVSLSPTLTFNYPNVEAIVNYLIEEVLAVAFTVTESQLKPEEVEPSTTNSVEELSEAEAEMLLLSTLESL